MNLLISLCWNGVILGLLYALFAYGLSLIIQTTSILHFAHGLTIAASAYVFWWLYQHSSLNIVAAVLVTLVVGGLIGVAIEALVYRPMLRAQAHEMVVLVASIVVMTLGQNLLIVIFGSANEAVSPSAWLTWQVTFGPIAVSGWDLLVIGASATTFGALHLLQTRTVVGLRLRAVGDNPERAQTLGIKPERVYLWVFFIGSVVAAVAAILLGLQQPVTSEAGLNLLVKGIIALVIGGVGSMPGALAGGVLIGLVEGVMLTKLSTGWAEFGLFGLLFIFMVARPQGLTRVVARRV